MVTCPRCETANPLTARFCMNCGAALPRRCTNCSTELPPGARFCMHCGQPVITSTPADENRRSRLAAVAPAPLVEKARAAQIAGERRMVTALLVDVVGSTALAEQVDVETWTEIMNGAFDRLIASIYRYEGTIARLLGDSLLVFFGAPVAHEDDPIRAVRAALDAINSAHQYAREVREQYGVEFSVRACINTGDVITDAVSEDLTYEYTAVGGAVNLVSRLKFAAQPMTVLISGNTYRFVEPVFECEDLGTIEVKGRQEPVQVYQVIGPKAQPGALRGLTGLESPMVGRAAELQTLLGLCEAARAGLGRAALIVAEPGLGKTRLIAEWKKALPGGSNGRDGASKLPPPRWAEGRCLSYGQGLAYHLLIDLLRSLVGASVTSDESETRQALLDLCAGLGEEITAEFYPFLGHLLSVKLDQQSHEKIQQLDPEGRQAHYLSAIRALLRALGERGPVIVVLEDLHWSDPSSIDLLINLLSLISEVPLLLCMAIRPDLDSHGWRLVSAARERLGGSLTELTLHALTEIESRQLVANLLAIEALPESMRRKILAKAEGNPLFVEEVIRMLIDQGIIARKNGGWEAKTHHEIVEIPDNLQGLLLARIDRLPDEVKNTLRVAAVIGRQFPVKVLAQVLARGRES